MTDYERQLHDALSEVMDWIENWNPDFIQDDEWPATQQSLHTGAPPVVTVPRPRRAPTR